MNTHSCRALVISAAASGQGKTLITGALARFYRRQGLRVNCFKFGPDYLDPLQLEAACGTPVAQLDPWLAGVEVCQQLLYDTAGQTDVILIEGAMGLYDGKPSTADLAAHFQLPLLLVIDGSGMAGTMAAVAHGLASYRKDLVTMGVIANRLGSARHLQLIADAMPQQLKLLGSLPKDSHLELAVQHLGLVPPQYGLGHQESFEEAADALERSEFSQLPPLVDFNPVPSVMPALPPLLSGRHIAVAKDDAFLFIYPTNLEVLQKLGASISFFSPINDRKLPEADAYWLPGGYPELYLDPIADNLTLSSQLQSNIKAGTPVLAECGGLLYCLEQLTDANGNSRAMLGMLAGTGQLQQRGGCQGMQSAPLPEGSIRAHSHHRATCQTSLNPISHGVRPYHHAPGEAIYRSGNLTATFMHLYFPSNPVATAHLFNGMAA